MWCRVAFPELHEAVELAVRPPIPELEVRDVPREHPVEPELQLDDLVGELQAPRGGPRFPLGVVLREQTERKGDGILRSPSEGNGILDEPM
jgi:hypothetical protein